MTLTVRNVRLCRTGGAHVVGDLYVDGVLRRSLSCDKEQVLTAFSGYEPDELFALFCRVAAAGAGATTLAQAKAAIEAAEWRL